MRTLAVWDRFEEFGPFFVPPHWADLSTPKCIRYLANCQSYARKSVLKPISLVFYPIKPLVGRKKVANTEMKISYRCKSIEIRNVIFANAQIFLIMKINMASWILIIFELYFLKKAFYFYFRVLLESIDIYR